MAVYENQISPQYICACIPVNLICLILLRLLKKLNKRQQKLVTYFAGLSAPTLGQLAIIFYNLQ